MTVSSEEGERPRVRRRGMRSLATALLLWTALVVATVSVHIQQAPSSPSGNEANATATTWHHHRTAFIWISAAVLLLAWIVLWILHSSSPAREQIIRWKRARYSVPVVPFLYAALSALALGLGAYGLWTCSETPNDYQLEPDLSPRPLHPNVPNGDWSTMWPTATAAATAAAWLIAAVALVVLSIVSTVEAVHAGQETPPALMLLRCSCCSTAVRRAVLALPFAALAVASGVLWRQASTNGDGCVDTARELLLGSAVFFGAIVLALGVATVGPVLWRRPCSSSATRRRLCHALVFCVLIGFGTATILWAVKSWRWLGDYEKHPQVMDCVVDARTVRAVRFTTGALFTAGVLILAMTSCCRLERHLLPTAATPEIDLSMLSPHAIRPPAPTKSPEEV